MNLSVIDGDILDQNVDVIVNPWNRNIFPWWLLLPQGVSGAIKKKAGYKPFNELPKFKLIPLGGAVITSAGKLNLKAIIHVAGINLLWRATEYSIKNSVINAVKLAYEKKFNSIAFPLIGAGTGSFSETQALEIMQSALKHLEININVIIVKFKK
tara:strand:+ start:78 stop:542 length:465 start_codon:yes stop_codon:yes gene_type:complete